MRDDSPLPRLREICAELEQLRREIYRSRFYRRAVLDYTVSIQVRRGNFSTLSIRCRQSALHSLPSMS